MDKSYRIHTNIAKDTLLQVNMTQDFDFLEVLSLRLRQKDAYRLHSSNYGVIIGRVLANDAFGIPNAKLSVFVERDTNDSTDIEALYPYSEVTTRDKEGRRYNILPDYSDDDCYRVVGTFPNKRLMLDDDMQLEIYDKYYRFTTVTNSAGDYMIFGVPTGNTTLHVDIDLSDIGVLSQKPRDFEYKGYNLSMFDNPNQFKESTNLDNLAQIFSQNRGVFVNPFWGDADNGIASLTRADIQIEYKFEPTCVFIGSIVSDNEGHAIGHKCEPDVNNGMNDQLVGGSGTIEMIRKTTDGLVEEYQVQGNQLIDENGVWCYQIPMNLDFIGTDEYGNIVPTDNPSKGIPTRAQVRFRISKNETNDEGFSRHTAKYLVPMNPIFSEKSTIPTIDVNGSEIERMYNFGSATPDNCFRDLYWNNVYSVKNYIPKIQIAHRPISKNYSALKGANLAGDLNPIPFNKLRIDIPFTYMMTCILMEILLKIVTLINLILCVVYSIINIIDKILKVLRRIPVAKRFVPSFEKVLEGLSCLYMSAGLEEGNTVYYPGCWCNGFPKKCPEEFGEGCEKRTSSPSYEDRVQRNLAKEYKIVKLDFYQDWINGCLYMPLWYWRKRKKRTFLFGLIKRRAKNEFCSCENDTYTRLKTYTTCEIPYDNVSFDVYERFASEREEKWHKNKSKWIRYMRGIIRPFTNKDNLVVYYYAALQATSDNRNPKQALSERPKGFHAVRLYATDLILLGNLTENNIYGIPQFFRCLPSTTANVPAIATIEEANSEEIETSDEQTEVTDSEDGGTTVVTGMDWGRKDVSSKESPMYKGGLFMDLACAYVNTKAKSCINVERLSELGVTLDTTYVMRYSRNGMSKEGEIKTDGFITKLELDDMENRAMFATLNHIGFIPQPYQASVSACTTQVLDSNTNYFVPKFKYIYPVDFDGRQQIFMDRYRNGFDQALSDVKDESYITFRLGAESGKTRMENSEHKIRHFYRTKENSDAFYMPLYNNSYYFYFGVKKGNTAIDKFNEMFNADCFSNVVAPFTISLTTRPRSYCPASYSNISDGFAYIMVFSDDIRKPFSYELRDENDIVVIREEGMDTERFVIGGYLEDGNTPVANQDGKIHYQRGDKKSIDAELNNQQYYLTLIDSEGKSITEKVNLEMGKITVEYTTTNLSSKFYSSAATRIDYICHDDNHYYGSIDVSSFTVDGYRCEIDDASVFSYSTDSGYTIDITGHSDVHSSLTARLTLKSIDGETDNCMCDKNNAIAKAQGANMSIDAAKKRPHMLGLVNGILSFFVYKPSSFDITITQICNGLLTENSSSSIATIYNADNFNTFLNGMPTLFMLGSNNDSHEASVASGSRFYSRLAAETPRDKEISGWYGVHREDTYMFSITQNQATDDNIELWRDFVPANESVHSHRTKIDIIEMKFNAMFSLSNAIYVQDNEFGTLSFTSTGGTKPIVRNISPYYESDEEFANSYFFKDNGKVTYNTNYPNIVGFNADGSNGESPSFNRRYNNEIFLGNYFAAFTNNAGYIAKNKIDGTINIARQPNFASISPYGGNKLKKLGEDEKININDVPSAYNWSIQKLEGDRLRAVNPWLRALTIDRRYDYDFTILGPAMNSDFTLYGNEGQDRPWQSLRISGFTYNGIEMSYDNEHNIISATTVEEKTDSKSGEVTAQRANNRLEYSYYYSDGDIKEHKDMYGDQVEESIFGTSPYLEAVTVYNTSNGVNTVWSNGHFGFNPTIDKDGLLIKESFTNEFGGYDIRNFYWSNFNRNRLSDYCDQQGGFTVPFSRENPFYVFNYPSRRTDLYNGEFDVNNYPTIRYLDIGNIPPSYSYEFTNEGCSYDISPEYSDDGFIKCKTEANEVTTFEVTFDNPISFIPPNPTNKEYGNITFRRGNDNDGYARFESVNASLNFNYKLKGNEDFNVYTRPPRVISVLNDVNTDGITRIKTAGTEKNSNSLANEITNLSLYEFETISNAFWDIMRVSDIFAPQGVSLNNGFFTKDGERLNSDDNDFGSIRFFKEGIDLDNTNAFTILVDREYQYIDDESTLTRHLRVLEFSDIYDARHLLVRALSANTDDEWSYVELRTIETTTPVEEVVSTTTEEVTRETGEITYETEIETERRDADGSGRTYIQTLSFEMRFSLSGTPSELQNSAFSDFVNMGYVFEFVDSSTNRYFIEDGIDVTPKQDNNVVFLRFRVRWSQDMGILRDDRWAGWDETKQKGKNPVNMAIYAKTTSNFTYKLGDDYFQIKLGGQDELPDKEGDRSNTFFFIA